TGVEGKMFKPMAYTFGFAMIGAIILCLTYVPMMSALFMKPVQNTKSWFGKFERWLEKISDKIIGAIHSAYKPLLKGALRLKLIVLSSAAVLLIIAGFIFSNMGGEFVPQLDEGDIAMQAFIRPGSSLTESIEVSKKIETILLENFSEIKTVTARIGVADIPTDPMPMDIADMYIILNKDIDDWTTASTKAGLIDAIRDKLDDELVGVNLSFTQPVELRFNELLEGVREDIAVKLYGEDLEVLSEKVQEMAAIIQTVPGAGDVSAERTAGLPQMTVKFRRDKMAQYGLDIQKVNDYISTAFAGGTAGVIFEGEKRFDLVVRFDESHRKSIDDLRNMYIDLKDGSQVPIIEIAAIEYVPGPMQISRDNTYRRTYVGVNARDRDVESVVKDIQQKLDEELDLPSGYYITYGGEFENLQSAKDRLTIVVPIALFLIFVLLYFALKSFSQSLMIYIAIPLAAIGGVFALWLRDMPFSISAGVGFIVLFGVAVLNGLVLINRFNSLKEEGVTNINDRIFQGTKERIRPIMLTATTDIFGFLPMAFSTSAGAEVQQPLATVVIGGMLTATLLTLVVLPVLYTFIEKRRERKDHKKIGSFHPQALTTILIFGFMLGGTAFAKAQQSQVPVQDTIVQDSLKPITLSGAVEIAKDNYPALKTSQLEIERQSALAGNAYDFGNTQVFTGGEEVADGQGIYTLIGVGQQNIDLLGIGAKKRLQQQRIELAQTALDLSEIQIEREVKKAWSEAFQTKKKFVLYRELDSIYGQFAQSVELNYEVEAISRLEYAAARNQALQINNKFQQAETDYSIALQKLNLWLTPNTMYTVTDEVEATEISILETDDTLNNHPELSLSRKRIDEAQASYDEARANLLPKFNLQGGLQRVNGDSGFYTYQAGISIPLLSGPVRGRAKAAKLDAQIAETNAVFKQRELQSQYKQAQQNYVRWRETWLFYKTEALPLAIDQRKGALLAYKEGALDYAAFTQIIRDAIQIEMDALDALDNYLEALFELQYFQN
ncbi:CusA/CzcA family heavy metal efflux RND transporter, partial [Croceibacter atlanticus]